MNSLFISDCSFVGNKAQNVRKFPFFNIKKKKINKKGGVIALEFFNKDILIKKSLFQKNEALEVYIKR